MIEPLKLGAKTYRLGWSVDTYLLPECRGQNIGYELQKANNDGNEVFMSLAMSKANRHIKMKLGGSALVPVTVFARLARSDAASVLAALRHRLSDGCTGSVPEAVSSAALWVLHFLWLDRLAAAIVNVGVGIRDRNLRRRADTHVDVSLVDRFGCEADELWASVSPHFHAAVHRSSAYLNWKYVQQPHMHYQILVALRNGRMCGYVVLRRTRRPESNTGIIADLLAPPGDDAAIYTLLSFAVQHLRSERVERIEAASSVDAYRSALLALGFKKTTEVTPVYQSRAVSGPVPGGWLLGRSDHDWDQYPNG
jgi:hypothetical protein